MSKKEDAEAKKEILERVVYTDAQGRTIKHYIVMPDFSLNDAASCFAAFAVPIHGVRYSLLQQDGTGEIILDFELNDSISDELLIQLLIHRRQMLNNIRSKESNIVAIQKLKEALFWIEEGN